MQFSTMATGQEDMLNICIVEDELDNLNRLKECIERFCKENGHSCNIESFSDGLDFLASYRPGYDLVFFDIQLTSIDGMETARRLRQLDSYVGIIFVTNLLKYAIHGYEVNAFDYIIKPVDYYDFSVRMKKFIERFPQKEEQKLLLSFGGKKWCIAVREITYVETQGHNILYHLVNGDISVHGSLTEAEHMISSDCFIRCNSGFLVNLNHVQAVDKDSVCVAGKWLPISRPKKKEFITAVTKFIAGL